MNSMINANIQSVIDTALGWVIVYLVVYFFAYRKGLTKNLKRNALNRVKSLRKTIADQISKGSNSKSAMIAGLHKVVKLCRKADSILIVDLYDHGDSPELKTCRNKLTAMQTKCRLSAKEIAEENDFDYIGCLNSLEDEARMVQDLLDKSLSRK